MGKIITFYSYKGGVGRSMCLANIGVLLARWEYKVLLIDWDLEAPGLENFFTDIYKRDITKSLGLIDILIDLAESKDVYSPNIPLINNWDKFIENIPINGSLGKLDMITAGRRDEKYYEKVRNFDVKSFYSEKRGGQIIEKLRSAWKDQYDFILVDSRTGITDIGGICTIQLPDILVLLFTPTEQGFRGIGAVAEKVLNSQRNLPLERLNLLIFPILTRIDGSEKKLTKEWIEKFIEGSENLPISLNKIYKPWLPENIERKAFVQQVLVPYVAYYSFGEGLPVYEEDYATDVQGMGYAYESIAASLATHLNYPHLLIDDRTKLLKIANKNSVKQVREEILGIVNHEIGSLNFSIKANEKVKQSFLNSTNFITGDQDLINYFQEVVREVIPSKNVSLSDIERIKEGDKKHKEEYSEWYDEDPLDQLSDHLAIKIFYQIKDIDRDIILSLKDDLGKSIIDNVSTFVVLFDTTVLVLKNNCQKEVLGKNINDNIRKNLELIQFELSRSISDKLFFLLKDLELLKLGKKFDEIFLEKSIGLESKKGENPKYSAKSSVLHNKLIGAFVLLCLITLFIFFFFNKSSLISEDIGRRTPELDFYAAKLKDSADEFSIYGDSQNAKKYYEKAANQALAVQDINHAISILKDQSINLTDSSITTLDNRLNQLLMDVYDEPLYKVEIFYVDSLYERKYNNGEKFQVEYAEVLAEQLLRELNKQSNFVVKKRLFRPKYYTSNPYMADQNEIRYEKNSESKQANQILNLANNSRLKERNISFVLRPVSYNSPNYISIILKNNNKDLTLLNKKEVAVFNELEEGQNKGPEIYKEQNTSNTRGELSIPIYKSSGWFKEGFILRFENLRLTLDDLNVDEQLAKITVCEQEDRLHCRVPIKTITIKVSESQEFPFDGRMYRVNFNRIGKAGKNRLKLAAYISFEKY